MTGSGRKFRFIAVRFPYRSKNSFEDHEFFIHGDQRFNRVGQSIAPKLVLIVRIAENCHLAGGTEQAVLGASDM